MLCLCCSIVGPLACEGGAVLGDPVGSSHQKVILPQFTQAQILDIERKNDAPEKLAIGLLQLLFTTEELSRGNCTKPVRGDIQQLDSERLWAIRCKSIML